MVCLRSVAIATTLCHIANVAPLGRAQLDANLGFTSSCPMDGLSARITGLNSACCVPAGDGSGGECAETCDAACVGTLFPLLDDCRPVMNTIYDGADGVEDGEASVITSIYDECSQVQPEDLIDMLKTLQDQGQCPHTVLDGVSETVVEDAACADSWTGGRCEMSIASGVFSCESDFCKTVPTRDAPCVVAGQCDHSCEFCGEGGGGHRRSLAARRPGRSDKVLRRLQLGNVQCDPATFAAEAQAVDSACCDDDGGACTDGVPTQCDAKCAVKFNNFYSRCQRFMSAQFSLDIMDKYDRLYATCTAALPAEPLLRALVVCSNRAPDPCWGMDCGEHGTCSGGVCRCVDADYIESGGQCTLTVAAQHGIAIWRAGGCTNLPSPPDTRNHDCFSSGWTGAGNYWDTHAGDIHDWASMTDHKHVSCCQSQNQCARHPEWC